MKTKEIKRFRKDYTKYEKTCVFEGYKLAVLFDEKEDVKRYGGRWDAQAEHWWMPANRLLAEIHDNGTLVRDELNDNKMIMGQYGKFADTANNRDLCSGLKEHREYVLRYCGKHTTHHNGVDVHVRFFEKNDVATFGENTMTEFYTIEDGRKRWDDLISDGYNRIEIS